MNSPFPFRVHLAVLSVVGAMFLMLPKGPSASLDTTTSVKRSPRTTVFAAGRGNPFVNLTDGRSPQSLGSETTTQDRSVHEDASLTPLGLTSADFDEDGADDLAVAYADGTAGFVNLRRGNLDALYPDTLGARARREAGTFTDEPLSSPSRVVSVPEFPSFIAAGDFNGDGHSDIVTATRGGNLLRWVPGDGRGGFGPARTLALAGGVTAMTSADVNRRDGRADVLVGVEGTTNALLVFENSAGAFRSDPETIPVAGPVTSIAVGQFDDDACFDIAATAGAELVVVRGRNRALPRNTPEEINPVVFRRAFAEPLADVVVGRFIEPTRDTVAVSTQGGEIMLLEAPRRGNRTVQSEPTAATLRTIDFAGPGARLVAAKTSKLPTEDLLVFGTSKQIRLLNRNNPTSGELSSGSRDETTFAELASFDTVERNVAVLPMRLNGDALSDLVVLQEGDRPVSRLTTKPNATFVVNAFDDNPDTTPGDGSCDDFNGRCSLRAAIMEANAFAGADTINFSVTLPITITSALPTVTETVTIDGTTAPATLVDINGSGAGAGTNGLTFSSGGGGSTIRGLVIRQFNGAGIVLDGSSNNLIVGNRIGTNLAGAADNGNSQDGIRVINGAAGNTIGGNTATPGTLPGNVISGNNDNGIEIDGENSDNTVIRGNIIGLSAAGTADLGNSNNGVCIDNGADSTTIGGGTAGDRNIISGNNDDGVDAGSGASTGTTIQGNFIGTNLVGTADLGNTDDGIDLGGAPGCLIGGNTATPGTLSGNVISGNNDEGIELNGATTVGTDIRGNIIGLSAAGTADLGNSSDGVCIGNSADNASIGGGTAGDGNVISGNNSDGVEVGDSTVDGTTIRGNFIGTNLAGTGDLGNTDDGVNIINAPGCVVGGNTATPGTAPGNVISGNNTNGIEISGDPADGTDIRGNIIGLSAAGTADLGNTIDGVCIGNSADNTSVGGGAAGDRNVISGNNSDGVEVNSTISTGTTIRGNFIGTDITGTADVGNSNDGVNIVGAPACVVGGNTATPGTAPGNVISGNNTDGVQISGPTADGTDIRGNIIGLNATGTAALGNGINGVCVNLSGDGTLVGGTAAGDRNIVSGNGDDGIDLNGATATATMIRGNFIGTDINGTTDLGNAQNGIRIDGSPSNTIGENTATPGTAAGNVISGNDNSGILIDGVSADNTTIRGNLIGLNAGGTAALGNSNDGVSINIGPDNITIGGGTAGDGNVVSGNGDQGVSLSGAGTTGTTIQGNRIGTQATGASAVANGNSGVGIDGATGTLVGGTTAGQGNLIAFNTRNGVEVPTGTGNRILGNSIHSNLLLGIDLSPAGVTPNDMGDPDTGANNLQNFPLLGTVISTGGNTQISGSLNGTANRTFRVEFFSNNVCDPTGFGEGETFLGFMDVTTDPTGNTPINAMFAVALTSTQFVTATATDSTTNDTSEFSACAGINEVEGSKLLVADTQNHRIQQFDGNAWSVLVGNGVPGIAPTQCRLPEAVAGSIDGMRIYIADTGNNRITYSTDGGASWAVFVSGPGIGLNQVNGPQGVALDPAGNLYVADTNNNRVMRFNGGMPGTGILLASVGIAPGQVRNPRGLAVAPNFTLYVADRDNNRIGRIPNANMVAVANTGTTVIVGPGIGLNQARIPDGVGVDNAGNLYVADTGNNRVMQLAAGASPGTVMTAGGGGLIGLVGIPEGVTVSRFTVGAFADQSLLVVGDTGNNRIQSRLVAGGPWQNLGTPNGIGSFVGQFRTPSKIK